MKENFSNFELRVIKGLIDSRLSRYEFYLAEEISPYDKAYLNSSISQLLSIRDKLDLFLNCESYGKD